MIKVNLKPSLRFPEFDTQLKESTLGEIADITKLAGYEYTKHIVYSKTGNIIGLRALNIKNNVINTDNVQYIDQSDFSKLSRSKLFTGDLLFTYIGASIGDIAVVPENDKYYLAPNIARIRCDEIYAHSFFIFQYFRKTKFKEREIVKYVASSSQPALAMENIRKFRIVHPDLPEQQKIASFLSAVDRRIELLEKKKQALESYKKGLMQKLFPKPGAKNPELRFKDTNGQGFPDWEDKKLGDCLSYEQPTKYLVSDTEYRNEYLTPVLTAGKTFILGYTNEKEGVFRENLPVIIFDDFTTASQFVDFPFKAKSSAMKILSARDGVQIKFMFETLQLIKYELGGHGRHWISVFEKMTIPIPIYSEQTRISEFVTQFDMKIDCVAKQIDQLNFYKKGLLQKMFV